MELRIAGFPGEKEARLIFSQSGGITIEAIDDAIPGAVSATDFAREALDWVLFGRMRAGGVMPGGCSAELEFDQFAVHRKTIPEPPGIMLRLFRYSSNPYACVATVKDLTAETVEDTQREIQKVIGVSKISALIELFEGSAAQQRS